MSQLTIGGKQGESSGDVRFETVVIDLDGKRNSCGYCKSSSDSAISHGLWALSMTVEDYQELIDHGWRRSGRYVYKPDMENTCCPQYTIRLKADEFVASKEQVRVLKKMKRFLDGNQLNRTTNGSDVSGIQESLSSSREVNSGKQIDENRKSQDEDSTINYLSTKIEEAINACLANGDLPSHALLPKVIVKRVKAHTKKKLKEISDSDHLLYTSSISFQIAAALKRLLITTTSNENQSEQILKLSPNEISKILAFSVNKIGLPMDIFVQACNGHLNFYSPNNVISESCHRTAKEMGQACNHSHKLEGSSTAPLRIHNLEIRMKQSHFDPEEYELYRKYQVKVHDDKPESVSEDSYKRFLVDSPLIFCPPQSGKKGPSCGFGSFHQQYLIDGKVIAVGVVDILPKCLSSKYLFWDPDYAPLSLGKYTALKEIDWVKDAQSQCGSLQYYYLGYYIHSCSKMKYKSGYFPSELLCPLRYRWVPYDIARPFLDRKSYVVLSDSTTTQNAASTSEQGELLDDDKSYEFDIGQIIIEIRNSHDSHSRLKFVELRKLVSRSRSKRKAVEMLGERIRKYVKLVGMVAARNIIYSVY